MKRFVFWQILIAALLMAPDSQAQSLKDLLNKENIEKAVNAITGKSTASMEGTWTYAGSAIEFESDNLLQKADTILIGGAEQSMAGYEVGNECIGCKLCFSVCPQKCIDITRIPAVIDQHQCLHCGRCAETCPRGTIRKRGQ